MHVVIVKFAVVEQGAKLFHSDAFGFETEMESDLFWTLTEKCLKEVSAVDVQIDGYEVKRLDVRSDICDMFQQTKKRIIAESWNTRG